MTFFDHLVIGAESLEQGAAYIEEKLGVRPPFGGKHPLMGTHNCLTRLGNTCFLEIIAIDPEASRPSHPRWFGLDDPHIRSRLALSPRLLTWVVNCEDITATLNNPVMSFGSPQPLSRGDLRWYFGVPDDGRLLAGGMLPYVISWQIKGHPATGMSDQGCSLKKLKIYTPLQEWTLQQLEDINARDLVEVELIDEMDTPFLEAEIQSPLGACILRSCGPMEKQ
ncbi:MAG: VOC family protein [Desulfopila sp.]|jgi:hypothetical protein|nr:VOC family protein [Desulfopila sp.]